MFLDKITSNTFYMDINKLFFFVIHESETDLQEIGNF